MLTCVSVKAKPTLSALSALKLLLGSALCVCVTMSSLADSVLVGTENIQYYPHYGKRSQDSKQFQGYARELLDRFFEQENIQVKYPSLPVKRLYHQFFNSQELDFKYPDNTHWAPQIRARHKVFYSEPVGHYIDGVMVHEKYLNHGLGRIKKMGILRGFTPESFLQGIQSGDILITEYARSSEILKALQQERIDGAYLNVDVALHQIKLSLGGESDIVFDPTLPYTQGTYRMSSIRRHDIIEKLNRFLAENTKLQEQLATKYNLSKRLP
jgi:hypothetical protein